MRKKFLFVALFVFFSCAFVCAGVYSPQPGVSWHWQLQGDVDLDYDVDIYDIDLFDTPEADIDYLHSRGVRVICYFSAGSWENWRDDASEFPSEVLGNNLDGWPGEKWLDVSQYELFSDIMEARLDLAVLKGCDGVEPDNVDGYSNRNGVGLTYEDQLAYVLWLSEEAHERNLSIGFKNALDLIDDVVDFFDFAVNEECFNYDECEMIVPFIEQNKAVVGVEYEMNKGAFCGEANSMNFSFAKACYDLDGCRDPCFEDSFHPWLNGFIIENVSEVENESEAVENVTEVENESEVVENVSEVFYHDADVSLDGVVDFEEIVSYLEEWSLGEGVSIGEVLEAILLWKEKE